MKYNVVAVRRLAATGRLSPWPAFRDVTPRTQAEAEAEAARRNGEDEEKAEYLFRIMPEGEAARL